MAFDDLARRMGAPDATGKDPNAILEQGLRANLRQERRQNRVLGVVMIAVAIAFAVFGVVLMSAPDDSVELAYGSFGGSLVSAGGGLYRLFTGRDDV